MGSGIGIELLKGIYIVKKLLKGSEIGMELLRCRKVIDWFMSFDFK